MPSFYKLLAASLHRIAKARISQFFHKPSVIILDCVVRFLLLFSFILYFLILLLLLTGIFLDLTGHRGLQKTRRLNRVLILLRVFFNSSFGFRHDLEFQGYFLIKTDIRIAHNGAQELELGHLWDRLLEL